VTEPGAPLSSYASKRAELESGWQPGAGRLRLEKSTISNLFRYKERGEGERRVSLAQFNQIIALDEAAATLEVEGLTTFETIVNYTVPRGFLPLVAPELKHITIGGATVGIGIESTCFRYGFVHDALVEADVLLPDGRIVTCTADNEHSDLFHGLPNSYGTLGYILRARIRLHRAKRFTHLQMKKFAEPRPYLDAMRAATQRDDVDFVEGLFYQDRRFILVTGQMVDSVAAVDDIMREHIYYKLLDWRSDVHLRTQDYIFRYDPEWFWNLPESLFYRLYRRYAPEQYRNSGFFTRYIAWRDRLESRLFGSRPKKTEPLIQDWEVPWDKALELIEFCIADVDLGERPWAAVPIMTPRTPTLYPIRANELYFNLGCYCQVDKLPGKGDYFYTRIMDDKCFELDGIKMLYSSTFLDEAAFDARFNGEAYAQLKKKYDPQGCALTLFEKVAMR
jgi:FAD/FMN-containing dehydrogenase